MAINSWVGHEEVRDQLIHLARETRQADLELRKVCAVHGLDPFAYTVYTMSNRDVKGKYVGGEEAEKSVRLQDELVKMHGQLSDRFDCDLIHETVAEQLEPGVLERTRRDFEMNPGLWKDEDMEEDE